MSAESNENPRTPENEIKQAVTPETARVMAGTVDTTYLKPGEVLPEDKIDQFKTDLMQKKEDSVNYEPLQKLSEQSRKEHSPGYDEWRTAVAVNIDYYAYNEKSPNPDEYIATLKSLGIEWEENKFDDEIGEKIDAFYDNYLDGKSDISEFVGKIAKDCKDGDGHTDIKKLESRLQAVKGLMNSFGRNEDAIPQLIEAHAKSQAILSQDGEAKQAAVDAAVDQMKQTLEDEPLKTGFEKLAGMQSAEEPKEEATEDKSSESETTAKEPEIEAEPKPAEESAAEPKTEQPKPETAETPSEAEKRYKELVEESGMLSAEELSEVTNKINDPNTSDDEKTELKEKRNKTRFKTENFDEMKTFIGLLFKDDEEAREGFTKKFEGASETDKAAGKRFIYAMELAKEANGSINIKDFILDKGVTEPQPEPIPDAPLEKTEDSASEPAEREIEEVQLPEPDTKPEEQPAQSEPGPTTSEKSKDKDTPSQNKSPYIDEFDAAERERFTQGRQSQNQMLMDEPNKNEQNILKEQSRLRNEQESMPKDQSEPTPVPDAPIEKTEEAQADADTKDPDENQKEYLDGIKDEIADQMTDQLNLEEPKSAFIAEPDADRPTTQEQPAEKPAADEQDAKFKVGDEVMYMTDDLTGTIKERQGDDVIITLKKNGEDLKIKWANLLSRGELIPPKDSV